MWNLPSLAAVFRTSENNQRPALLDTPKTRPILLGNPPQSNPTSEDLTGPANGGLDTLLNAQNLNQLLGSLNSTTTDVVSSTVPKPVQSVVAPPPAPQAAPAPPQPLLPTPATVASTGNYYQRPVLLDASSMAAFNPFLLQQQTTQQPHQQIYVPQQQLLGKWIEHPLLW